MEIISIDRRYADSFISEERFEQLVKEAVKANKLLHSGKGAGSDFLGWVDLPSKVDRDEVERIKKVAVELRKKAEIIVVIGIGGSYLGARAAIEALSDNFKALKRAEGEPTVIFAGQNISEDYLFELVELLEGREIATVVISKSGTTTEPAIAFRIIKEMIEKRYGEAEAAKRIVAITDEKRGALKTLADNKGYTTFVIPDNVGGRFSVLTPVGLLPIALAGIDIEDVLRGAREMEVATDVAMPSSSNAAVQYAAARNALYEKGYKIEILASYEPKLLYVSEWWKQLYGESEGKDGKGIFPASVTFTADLHSMGQYIQDGERTLFESVISVGNQINKVSIGHDTEDLDGLNYIAGRRIGDVNEMAQIGVKLAHVEGGVPNIGIKIPKLNEYYIGALLYMFEKACGISGYMLGVNPFDQPGVEAYKTNMFALLKKPGYEKETQRIMKKLQE